MKKLDFLDNKTLYLWIYQKSTSQKNLISEKELKWSKNLSESRSKEYILSRGLMRYSLSKLFKIKPLLIPLKSKPGLAPTLPKDFGYVSLSHCKDAILLGWYHKKIGIDIERRDRVISKNLKNLFFCKNEYVNNKNVYFNNENEFLLALWTAKESAIKWDRSSIYKDINNWNFEKNFKIIKNTNRDISLQLINYFFKDWIICAVSKERKKSIKAKIIFGI